MTDVVVGTISKITRTQAFMRTGAMENRVSRANWESMPARSAVRLLLSTLTVVVLDS